jgi:hypothetical protein
VFILLKPKLNMGLSAHNVKGFLMPLGDCMGRESECDKTQTDKGEALEHGVEYLLLDIFITNRVLSYEGFIYRVF